MNRYCKFAVLLVATWLPAVAALAGPNTVQFDPTDYAVNESAGTVTLNVTAHRLGDSSEPISVTYTTRDDTATAGQDYTFKTGTVSFGPGETFKQIQIQILNDTLLENAERFFVDLSAPSGATLNTDPAKDTATVSIADDDSGASTFQFSSATYSVNEADGSVSVTVVRSGGLQLTASVNYATSNGTAQSGSDYTAASGTLTFNPGDTSKTIPIGITDDTVVEDSENFSITLSSPSFGSTLGTPSTATVTIADNDSGSTIQFSPVVYTVNEAAGQVILTVTASRLGNPNTLITVDFATRNGSATAGQDYVGTNGSITFGAGETQKQIPISIINDNFLENAENFFVDLSNPQNASLKSDGSNSATVNIADDDSGTSTIQFSSATYSVNESAGSVAVTVVRSGGVQLVVSASYSTTNGTAQAPSDYTASSGTVTFASGETQKTIVIPINEDPLVEGDETFNVTLSNPSNGATLGNPSSASATIIDDDGGSTIQFSPKTYFVNEAAGQVILTVTANRLGDPNTPISVDFATRDGSATAGQDYNAASGTITFGSGETQKQIAIGIVNDNFLENAESFFVDLSNPQGASFKTDGSATATVTISDDDSGTSTIQFTSPTYSVNENAGSVSVTVVRSGGVQLAVSADYATSNGTAQAPSDYTATSGTLTFASGETQKTINVPINDDALVEGNETFNVTLSNPSAGATLGSPSNATVTILDNDGGGNTVQFNPTTYSAKETPGNSTVTLSVTATRFGDPNTTIFADYATSNGTATAGQDYVATSGTVVFSPGETQKFITVTILDDNLIENAENFFVTLTSATNASINGGQATVTISDDDSPTATIGFSRSSYDVDEGAGFVTLTVTRSGGLSFAATVHYETSDQSAKAGTNYVASSGNLVFAPGETSKNINISIIDEGNADPTLTFLVTLSDPNGTGFVGGQSTATVNILDNDANTFRFASANYTVNEGAGSVTLTVDVVRSGDPAQTISVDYVTVDGSAQAGSKYTRTSGRLTFGANVTSQTITVPIIDEPFIEGTTDFSVVLSNALPSKTENGNAASRLGSPSSATVSIIDNDARTFQFSPTNYTIPNSRGSVNITVSFSRAFDPNGTFTVDYSTMDVSALAGRDYTPASGTLTFAPNETTKTITVQITPQPSGQPTRQFKVVLSNPSAGSALGQNSVATVTITNPDFSTKLFNISTRGPVQMGNDVMIAGFIVQGGPDKSLVLRGIGPSLTQFGVPSAIADPTLTLVDANGTQLASNDDYTSNSGADQQTLANNGLTPGDSRESAIVATIAPGAYTAILRGKSNGVGLIEVYDISNDLSTELANISTRGKVEMGDNGAMIAGFIVAAPQNQPGTVQRVAIRAIGPSLKNFGVSDALLDPTLDIYRGSQLILSNDNWKTNSQTNQQILQSNGLAPSNDKESAVVMDLDPGSYSAVVRGKGNTIGVGLVEVYNLTQ
ncbi:MAG: Calx-beta domain-containing protein [Chthoniobacterales bacterium]